MDAELDSTSQTKQPDQPIQIKEIVLGSIVPVQTRAELRQTAIEEYAERIRNGHPMDPAVVYLDTKAGKIWLASGHHRLAAYRLAERPTMPCVMKAGGKWNAVQEGLADNLRHVGVRLSSKDKAHAIKIVLSMRTELADEVIGDMCGACHDTVAKYRSALESTCEIRRVEKRIGRDGVERALPKARQGNNSQPPLESKAIPGAVAGDERPASLPENSAPDEQPLVVPYDDAPAVIVESDPAPIDPTTDSLSATPSNDLPIPAEPDAMPSTVGESLSVDKCRGERKDSARTSTKAAHLSAAAIKLKKGTDARSDSPSLPASSQSFTQDDHPESPVSKSTDSMSAATSIDTSPGSVPMGTQTADDGPVVAKAGNHDQLLISAVIENVDRLDKSISLLSSLPTRGAEETGAARFGNLKFLAREINGILANWLNELAA